MEIIDKYMQNLTFIDFPMCSHTCPLVAKKNKSPILPKLWTKNCVETCPKKFSIKEK